MTTTSTERARGALVGLALGDALGMPTQGMSRAQIATRYGHLDKLVDAVDDQPIAPGMAAGSVTDDTEQALLVARLLIEGDGTVDPRIFADALVDWERAMEAKGSRDLLGPSTKAAVAAIAAGADPATAGTAGTTNGAAMRIAPVAIAVSSARPDALLDAVRRASFVTHNTGLALGGAAAVAGAVSAGVDGAAPAAALDLGIALAERAEAEAPWAAGASVAARARWALRASADLDEPELADFLADVVGTSVQAQESVVTSLVLAGRFQGRPYDGICLAARLGGDTDTVAAMAGAMLGSWHGPTGFPSDAVAAVVAVSGLDFEPVLTGLLTLRGTAQPVPHGH